MIRTDGAWLRALADLVDAGEIEVGRVEPKHSGVLLGTQNDESFRQAVRERGRSAAAEDEVAMIDIGALVEIRPAYDSETHEQSIVDEIAYCSARVIRHLPGGYHLVWLPNGEECEIYVTRLRRIGRIE